MAVDKSNVPPETVAAIRAEIENVLTDGGPDVGDRLTQVCVAMLATAARDNDAAGYKRGVARFMGPVGDDAAPKIGKIDLVKLAVEVLDDIDSSGWASRGAAANAIAGCFSRLMKLRQDSICAMLDDEHARMARVARAFPTMANAVREQCAVVAQCIRLIDGGMLPAQFMPDTEPVTATEKP